MKKLLNFLIAGLSVFSVQNAFAISIPNLVFPETWIDDYLCYIKQTPEVSQTETTSVDALARDSVLAGLSYFPKPIAIHLAKKFGYKASFIDIKLPPGRPVIGTQALWLEKDGAHTLVIRGTNLSEGATDLITDALILQLPTRGGGKAHAGFVVAAETLWPFIKRKFDQSTSVRFVGHSLGAGVVTLLARRAANEGLPLQGVTLFGSPRVGDEDFTNQFSLAMQSIPMSRVTFRNDGMTRFPVKGYKHVGGFVYLDSATIQFDETFEATLPQTPGQLPKGSHPINDHMPYSYSEALYRLMLGKTKVCHSSL